MKRRATPPDFLHHPRSLKAVAKVNLHHIVVGEASTGDEVDVNSSFRDAWRKREMGNCLRKYAYLDPVTVK